MKYSLSRRAAVLLGLGVALLSMAPTARAQDPAAAAGPAPAGASPPAAGADAPDPQQAVDALHAALIDVMKRADELGYEGRYDVLEPVIARSYDQPYMAEKSSGRHWRKLDAGQREALVSVFSRFSIANYAGRFDGWSGQSFEVLSVEPSIQDTRIVRTKLVKPGDEDVQLDYRLHRSGEGEPWQIIDVYLNGTVSEIALRRSEYSSLIDREGFPALLAALESRIADLASGKAANTEH